MTDPVVLDLTVPRQPTETTCGPTCLHGVYRFYDDPVELDDVVDEVGELAARGTLAVLLASHARARGYDATLFSLNLSVVDPSWFATPPRSEDLVTRLEAQRAASDDPKLQHASRAYAEFVRCGGELRYAEITVSLIRHYLDRGRPLLAGVSATYLYGCARELPDCTFDDIRGTPQGHFVVICGHRGDEALIADPWRGPPAPSDDGRYWVPVRRLVHAILLGVLTYDGNLLVLSPGSTS